MKRLLKGNKFYRIRRGKLVEIPENWIGNIVHPQTIRKRNPIKRRTRKEK